LETRAVTAFVEAAVVDWPSQALKVESLEPLKTRYWVVVAMQLPCFPQQRKLT